MSTISILLQNIIRDQIRLKFRIKSKATNNLINYKFTFPLFHFHISFVVYSNEKNILHAITHFMQ